ncbi:hypothetical protein [Halobaculum sp. CBA1158]|nr:hypothetical protein [Halobaculum sp. CBA1158]
MRSHDGPAACGSAPDGAGVGIGPHAHGAGPFAVVPAHVAHT